MWITFPRKKTNSGKTLDSGLFWSCLEESFFTIFPQEESQIFCMIWITKSFNKLSVLMIHYCLTTWKQWFNKTQTMTILIILTNLQLGLILWATNSSLLYLASASPRLDARITWRFAHMLGGSVVTNPRWYLQLDAFRAAWFRLVDSWLPKLSPREAQMGQLRTVDTGTDGSSSTFPNLVS